MTRIRRSVGLVVVLACGVLAGAQPADASPTSGPTAAVSLGDSYISGEAGRWAGNSVSPTPGNDGTDRACKPDGPTCQVDKTRVYEKGTEDGGCHRSDTAEIKSASLPVDERIDLSCSGGVTKNIFRASQGGKGQNGEMPQADKLLPVAKAKNVKLVMLSIGGNDLGFASIIGACLQAYEAQTGPCEPSQQAKIDSLKPKVIAAVGKAIDEIRAVMGEAGYAKSDYRLIVQTYPSVLPRASENRYPELPTSERTVNGCPFYNQDSDWARDRAAPQIGAVAKAAAASRGVETLDLINAFQGHEFCSKTTQQSMTFSRPSVAGAEWGRFLAIPSTVQQGELQEAFHPNAYGQRALGECVTRAFAQSPGTFSCAGSAGIDPGALSLARVSSFPTSAGLSKPPTSCLAERSPVGATHIGRLNLGVTRTRLLVTRSLARVTPPAMTATRFRYCVQSSRGSVTAVFGREKKVELLVATAGSYGNRGVRPGVSSKTLRDKYPHRRLAGSGVYRISRTSRQVVGVRKGKVKFVGVVSSRVLKSKRLLREYVKRAGV